MSKITEGKQLVCKACGSDTFTLGGTIDGTKMYITCTKCEMTRAIYAHNNSKLESNEAYILGVFGNDR